MILLISYDLKGRERPSSYTAVREAIERKETVVVIHDSLQGWLDEDIWPWLNARV